MTKTAQEIAAAPYATLTTEERKVLCTLPIEFIRECRKAAGREFVMPSGVREAARRMTKEVLKGKAE